MQELYNQVETILQKIDFNAIWQGFTPCDFALYNDETVYFRNAQTPWDERFIGNTAIDINGTLTAIWHVSNPSAEDPELLAMGVIHEMFHAFQKQQGETRWPNEFEGFVYPQDLDNYQLKMAENFMLAKAFEENSRDRFEEFAVLRRARRRLVGDAITYELNAETFEGMAEYAGLMALKQISHEKFVRQVVEHLEYIRNAENLFNMRRLSYSVGCIMCLTLKSLGIGFHHQLAETRPLFELIQWQQNSIGIGFQKFQQNLHNRFENFRKIHTAEIKKSALITGFDPMNMVRLGDEFLCENFIMLDGEFIKGPVLLVMEKDSVRQVKGYVR